MPIGSQVPHTENPDFWENFQIFVGEKFPEHLRKRIKDHLCVGYTAEVPKTKSSKVEGRQLKVGARRGSRDGEEVISCEEEEM